LYNPAEPGVAEAPAPGSAMSVKTCTRQAPKQPQPASPIMEPIGIRAEMRLNAVVAE
jgi:hypothetical protein